MKPIDVIDLTRTMVAYDSVSAKSNVELAIFLGGLLSDMGFCVEELHTKDYPGETGAVKKANLIARIGPTGVEPLVLSGHMDVMPFGNLQEWGSDPLKLTQKGNKLYGRGSVDMKGPIAAMICATQSLLQQSPQFKRELIFCLTHDEEVGLKGARRIVTDKKLVNPKSIIIAEPTGLIPMRMHKGHLCLKIICIGEKAHASCPNKGVNAIELAAKVVWELKMIGEEFRQLKDFCMEPPFTTLNIAAIKGEAKVNEVPDRCEISLAIRPIPGQSTAVLYKFISERLAQISWDRKTASSAVSVSLLEKERGRLPTEPMSTPANADIVRIMEKITEKTAQGASYSTDASVLQQLGADCIIFGPGSIDVAHKPNEFIEISQLIAGVDFFTKIVKKVCLED